MKKSRAISAVVVAFLVVASYHHQLLAHGDSTGVTGNFTIDFTLSDTTRFTDNANVLPLAYVGDAGRSSHKSPWLAGGLSAVLPGSGQIYTEAPLWRTILYGAVEAASWTAYAVYTAKGNDATERFERYADRHWDVTKYVQWLADNYQNWGDEEIDKGVAEEALMGIYLSNDTSLPPWQRIDFEQLNRLERTVKAFSHTLPEYGDQQYYEEIGKYVQYRSGWDDHASTNDTTVYNPAFVTTRQLEYVDLRIDANDLLGYATTAVVAVLINHAVSMIDAALEARSYNVRLEASLHERSGGAEGALMQEARVGVSVAFR